MTLGHSQLYLVHLEHDVCVVSFFINFGLVCLQKAHIEAKAYLKDASFGLPSNIQACVSRVTIFQITQNVALRFSCALLYPLLSVPRAFSKVTPLMFQLPRTLRHVGTYFPSSHILQSQLYNYRVFYVRLEHDVCFLTAK